MRLIWFEKNRTAHHVIYKRFFAQDLMCKPEK